MREFVELVKRGNEGLRGRGEAFARFRDVLAEEMGEGVGVERVLGGGGRA